MLFHHLLFIYYTYYLSDRYLFRQTRIRPSVRFTHLRYPYLRVPVPCRDSLIDHTHGTRIGISFACGSRTSLRTCSCVVARVFNDLMPVLGAHICLSRPLTPILLVERQMPKVKKQTTPSFISPPNWHHHSPRRTLPSLEQKRGHLCVRVCMRVCALQRKATLRFD